MNMGHSMPNQHIKMSITSDFNETCKICLLRQVIVSHIIWDSNVVWLPHKRVVNI